MDTEIEIPQIETSSQSPEVIKLYRIIDRLFAKCQEQAKKLQNQAEMIVLLKEEINRLKGHKGKPKINPSKMENGKCAAGAQAGGGL